MFVGIKPAQQTHTHTNCRCLSTLSEAANDALHEALCDQHTALGDPYIRRSSGRPYGNKSVCALHEGTIDGYEGYGVEYGSNGDVGCAGADGLIWASVRGEPCLGRVWRE